MAWRFIMNTLIENITLNSTISGKRKWQHVEDLYLINGIAAGTEIHVMARNLTRTVGAVEARIGIIRKREEIIFIPQLPGRGWHEYDIKYVIKRLVDRNIYHTKKFDPFLVAKLYQETGRTPSRIIRKIFEINKTAYVDAGYSLTRCNDEYIAYLSQLIEHITVEHDKLKSKLNELTTKSTETVTSIQTTTEIQ